MVWKELRRGGEKSVESLDCRAEESFRQQFLQKFPFSCFFPKIKKNVGKPFFSG